MKKLPFEFKSWIEFHDYLQESNPQLLRGNKTIVFTAYDNNSFIDNNKLKVIEYRFTPTYIKKKCWEELQEYRLSTKETIETYHAIEFCEGYRNLSDDNLKQLLFKIRIHEK